MAEDGGRSSDTDDANKLMVLDSAKGTSSALELKPYKSPSETRLVVEQQPSTIPKRR